jgi:hypothetical protein
VKFFFAGEWRQTVNAKHGQTVFKLVIHPRGKSSAAHSVTASVRFNAATGAKP